MSTDYVAYRKHVGERLAQLGQELPGPMSGFGRLYQKTVEASALDSKTKELIALALAVVVHCDGCISYHVHDAIAAGATRQELMEAIAVAILMGGAPATVSATHVLDAIEQFSAQAEK